MGSVYKVENIETKSIYALKFLHKQQTNDANWRRFDIEAKTSNKLDHQNLIKVYETGLLPDGQPFFTMDLVEGESLDDLLRTRGRLSVAQAIKIFIQVGFALSYAHSNGVIHRDIKPSNIMIHSPDGETTLGAIVKVVDFGIAKLTGHDEFNQQTLTKTGEFPSTTKSGIRSFLFPPVSIGIVSVAGRGSVSATNEVVCPPNFQGINFRPEADLRRFPKFLNRFRKDDIQNQLKVIFYFFA